MVAGLDVKLKKFFWDVDFNRLDPNRDQEFIIERLLEGGDEVATRWLFESYYKKAISRVLKKSARISPMSANYWAIILNIPRQEISCLSKQFQNKPTAIWKY